jgi:integrase
MQGPVRDGSAPALELSLADLFASWLAAMASEVSADTARCWETYASAHFIPFFETAEELCSDARLGDYMRNRLTKVKRTTLKKELSALNRLFDWMVEQRLLDTKPNLPRIPKRATGTPHPQGKRETVTLTPKEMDAIVAQLPERSKRGYPMRAYYQVMRETGLRPSTLHRLRAPDDYRPGAQFLTIREDGDKARYGRELPLSDRARTALDSACPKGGTIFPKFDGRHTLRKAALAAGLNPERASKFSAYDLRHSLATELTERSGNLVGVGYLLGHKHVTTTNHYVHARRRAAESVLSGHRLGHGGNHQPGEASSDVGQVPETIGCGREDSNLHEFYLTRSLGDTEPSQWLNLLEKEGSADVGRGPQTTLSGHGVPAAHSPIVGVGELREAARALVLRVADGGELPIEALRDFAALTLRCELVHLAQRLHEAPPEFAARRAMELASLILTMGAKARGADADEAGDVPVSDIEITTPKGSSQ